MKSNFKHYSILLSVTLILASFSPIAKKAYSLETNDNGLSVTIEDINNAEPILIYISDETILFAPKSKANNAKSIVPTAEYPISTRVRVVQTSSNGLIDRDSVLGFYSSIASTLLSFIRGVPAMAVSTILSVIGLAASSNSYTQCKTFTSYVEFKKYGDAKWADDMAYSSWVLSGKRNHYKHVLGAIQNTSGQWTTKTYDYLSSPCRVEKGSYYDSSDTWFKDQAYQRIQSYQFLDDLPW